MLLIPYIENSLLSGVIGPVEADDSVESRSEQQRKGFSVAWFVLWINPTGFDYSGFRYGGNLLLGRGCTCCLFGMRSGLGEEEPLVTRAQSESAIDPQMQHFSFGVNICLSSVTSAVGGNKRRDWRQTGRQIWRQHEGEICQRVAASPRWNAGSSTPGKHQKEAF